MESSFPQFKNGTSFHRKRQWPVEQVEKSWVEGDEKGFIAINCQADDGYCTGTFCMQAKILRGL